MPHTTVFERLNCVHAVGLAAAEFGIKVLLNYVCQLRSIRND